MATSRALVDMAWQVQIDAGNQHPWASLEGKIGRNSHSFWWWAAYAPPLLTSLATRPERRQFAHEGGAASLRAARCEPVKHWPLVPASMLKLVALAVSRRGGVICRCCAGPGSFAIARRPYRAQRKIAAASWFAWPASLNWRTKRQTARAISGRSLSCDGFRASVLGCAGSCEACNFHQGRGHSIWQRSGSSGSGSGTAA